MSCKIKLIIYIFFIFVFKLQIMHSSKTKRINRKLTGPPYVVTLTFDPNFSNKIIYNDYSFRLLHSNNVKVYAIKDDNTREEITSNLVYYNNYLVLYNKTTVYSKISLEFQSTLTTLNSMFQNTDVASVVLKKVLVL